MSPAPKGNQFWKQRSKHGRDKLFKTPELLLEAVEEHFKWCIDNPIMESQVSRGKHGAELIEVPKMRAYTLSGLCIYLGCNQVYFNHFEGALKDKGKDNWTEEEKDFSKVITYIREVIYTQKFVGAASNQLNQNIIARDLGLVDKQENTVKTEQPLFPDAHKKDKTNESK